ncbi:MAG: hypothetical protein HOD60_08040 [Candidatus Nitrosopelagicus sp.]|jgi:hypothetical protein|nr:hypothetical protein [Candidatus Nitrosopelagicus sp.]
MSKLSCDQCGTHLVEITDVEFEVQTIFGSLELEMSLCKTCVSAMEYCVSVYLDTLDFLNKKMMGRALQLRNKTKRLLK